MSGPNWVVLLNRSAGTRPTHVDRVRDALKAQGIRFEIFTPASRDEAMEILAGKARDGSGHFGMVGGDGSVNLAANALVPLGVDPKPVIGVLPVGSGCDLLRTFGIPQNLEQAAAHLGTDSVYEIDVGTVEGEWGTRYFVNVAQAGVGAAAAETAPRITRRLGAARYPLAFGARLFRFPYARVQVITEKRTYESDSALAVILANAQFFAGGWNVAPKATLVDGVLDVQIISARKKDAPALVPKVIKGTHLQDRSVRRFKAAEFRLETSPVWPVEVDGDAIGNTTVSGRVVPAALHISI